MASIFGSLADAYNPPIMQVCTGKKQGKKTKWQSISARRISHLLEP
jgi:hypothetical protein